MSLDTWLSKHYPIEASKTASADALPACLLKWSGLFPAVLEEHGLVGDGNVIVEKDDLSNDFWIDDDTCPLCAEHLDDDCRTCPLRKLRGVPCSTPRPGRRSPYDTFVIYGDPQPMIALIQRAIDAEGK